MALCIEKRFGYAKLDSFCFRIDSSVNEQTIIDFGDGRSELIGERRVISHVYESYGTFTACLRNCNSNSNLECIKVVVYPYVEDKILFESHPLSGFASVDDGMNFEVCLSSNCPPPLRVHLDVINTLSPPESELPITPFQNCLPRHKFTVSEKFEDGVVILENPSKIFVNNVLVGYHDKFCFGYYDDYPSEKDIQIELERTCDECFDIDFDVCDPLSSCSIYTLEHLPLPFIDEDLGL